VRTGVVDSVSGAVVVLRGAVWLETVTAGELSVFLYVGGVVGAAAGVWDVGSGWGELDSVGALLDLGTGFWKELGCSVE
jgi:hypothetical protein